MIEYQDRWWYYVSQELEYQLWSNMTEIQYENFIKRLIEKCKEL